MERFRPNIVIKGAQAWEEDNMKVIRIGEIEFLGSKCCARCKMTTIDQSSGKFDGKEPLETLGSFRRQKDYPEDKSSGLMFGKNLIQMNPNNASSHTLSVGNPVEVLTHEDRTELEIRG